MKTILYTRVLSDEQANEGHSLEYQKNTLISYCKNNNLDNYELYEDAGYSAKNMKRSMYQK